MLAIGLFGWRYGLQKRPEVLDIGIRHAREGRVREGREVVRAIPALTLADRALEIGLGPSADARFLVWRDVGAVESPEWRFEPTTARIGRCASPGDRVATDAAGGIGQVLPFNSVALCAHCSGAGEQQCGGQVPRGSTEQKVNLQRVSDGF